MHSPRMKTQHICSSRGEAGSVYVQVQVQAFEGHLLPVPASLSPLSLCQWCACTYLLGFAHIPHPPATLSPSVRKDDRGSQKIWNLFAVWLLPWQA